MNDVLKNLEKGSYALLDGATGKVAVYNPSGSCYVLEPDGTEAKTEEKADGTVVQTKENELELKALEETIFYLMRKRA